MTEIVIESTDIKKIPFSFRIIDNPRLKQFAKENLNFQGQLLYSKEETYCYLKIDDDFILKLFHFIEEDNIFLPDYFPPKTKVGAHITVIYPQEVGFQQINLLEVNDTYDFDITDFIEVTAFNKRFFALVVMAPKLLALRKKYGLDSKLNYHGLRVPFHITIAVGTTAVA